ncbi:helix-turn-helix transcriptional regulator [Acuticoccus kandeliae]|uniref:helix-turn-helix transcriptional regulator n=1 Tax=Acuticoccus kandeliae TaxID=2073160 RepID=UPI000D3EB32D|nr:helix-turn-helix transcriptional regulator [Acuticoccus kandeliae]
MGHFNRILMIEAGHRPHRQSRLFTVPSDVTPLRNSKAQIDVGRFFVGTIAVGQVLSSGHDTAVTEPMGSTLIVPRRGRILSGEQNGATHTAGTGEALLFSANRRQTRVEPADTGRFIGVPIVIPTSELLETADRLATRTRDLAGLETFALSLSGSRSPHAENLISIANALYERVSVGDPRLLRRDAQASWATLLMDAMIASLDAVGVVRLPPATDRGAARRHVRNALDYMHGAYADIATIADVALACGTSTRTLEASFRDVWTQTPHQVLTEIRFQKARRLLVDMAEIGTVTDAAYRVGFSHLGRFSAEYRRRYDESPSRTIGRTRIG